MTKLLVPKEDINNSLDILENKEYRKWLQDDSVLLSESLETTLSNILKNKRNKLKVFLLSLVTNRINKLSYLFEKEADVARILLEDKLDTLTPNQLISLFKTMHMQIKDTLTFFDYLSNQEADTTSLAVQVGDKIEGKLAKLSPESRNKLRIVMAQLLNEVGDDDVKKEGDSIELSP